MLDIMLQMDYRIIPYFLPVLSEVGLGGEVLVPLQRNDRCERLPRH